MINRGSIAVIIIIYLEFAVAFFLANLAAILSAFFFSLYLSVIFFATEHSSTIFRLSSVSFPYLS